MARSARTWRRAGSRNPANPTPGAPSRSAYAAEFCLLGHPDKLCDAIADGLVEEAARRERRALCGVEVAVHRATVFVTGRIACLGAETIDAACLVMPLVGFVAPTDPRWLSTFRAIEARLVRNSLVRRYDMEGMDTDAGSLTAPTFTICSFWYVECLARAGERDRARAAMRDVLRHANHLGSGRGACASSPGGGRGLVGRPQLAPPGAAHHDCAAVMESAS